MKALYANLLHYHLYHKEPLPPITSMSGYDYVLASNGLFKRGENSWVSAVFPIKTFDRPLPGLSPLSSSFQLKIPRIPAELLRSILNQAIQCSDASSHGIESMFFIKSTDTADSLDCEGSYQIVRPDSEVDTAGSVSYRIDQPSNIIMDLHSHHNMKAFFSQTDNADEQGFRFYGVLGQIHTKPTLALRLGLYGDFLPISVRALFSGDLSFLSGDKTLFWDSCPQTIN